MLWIVVGIVAWLICAVMSYGITFAYFQKSFPRIAEDQYREHLSQAVLFGLLGPLGLFVSLFGSGFAKHGLKFK